VELHLKLFQEISRLSTQHLRSNLKGINNFFFSGMAFYEQYNSSIFFFLIVLLVLLSIFFPLSTRPTARLFVFSSVSFLLGIL